MITTDATPRRAYAVWAVALAVYLLAVFHRSSLAVAGLVATDRFDISAAQLATFTTVQLLVYAGMQIPVGLLVDRFGPRAVLIAGALTLTLAQTGFALVESYPWAVVARVFVGVGDAMTFICVLRLVNSWFPSRRIPIVTQLTGVTGQLGAVLAAVPMTIALRDLGWTPAYLLSASLGLVVTVGLVLVVRDAPAGRTVRGEAMSLTHIRMSLGDSWRQPGTRLGFWMHFTTQFSATTLGLLWGYPFFVRGECLSPGTAGTLLTLMVVALMGAGPLLGRVITLHPWHRSSIVISIVWAIVAIWTVVLLWPGEAPLPVLVVLVLVVGIGGPASVIGFDLARTSNPAYRVASATAIVNQAGFIASLLLVISIGVILDWRTPGDSDLYTPSAFRWAMSAQYVLWSLGLLQLWRWRRRTRAALLAQNPDARAAMTRLG